MTFLEFTVRRLLGEPACYVARDPTWKCPWCGREKLHCMPASDSYKPRVKCWGCDTNEDAPGLWKLKNPGRYYRDACEALTVWEKEWEKQETIRRERARSYSSGGFGGAVLADARRKQRLAVATSAAWAELSEFDRFLLTAAHLILRGLRDEHPDVTLDALAKYCHDFEEGMQELEQLHLRDCDDPECAAAVCRPFLPDRRFKRDTAHAAACHDPECQHHLCREARRTDSSGPETKSRFSITRRRTNHADQPQNTG